jgi:hypothetical protein
MRKRRVYNHETHGTHEKTKGENNENIEQTVGDHDGRVDDGRDDGHAGGE